MKGKGKEVSSPESKDCPLQLFDVSPIEIDVLFPKLASILQKPEEDGAVSLEDLDPLQLELETLLLTLIKRKEQFEQENQVLASWQDKKEKKMPEKEQECETPGKRSRPVQPDNKPCKRSKDNSGKGHATPAVGRPPKNKNVQAKMQEYEFTDSPEVQKSAPKNDAPHRFWASVEPYCAEITQADLNVLEDLIALHDEDPEYFKVPPLGKHYSLKWAQDDIIEEQKESGKTGEKRRGISTSESDKHKNYDSDDTSPFGALTQRLVSCLIEENLMSPIEDNVDGSSPPSSKSNFIKSLNTGNTHHIEKRIKKELEEQGILDMDGLENPEDEILAELKKCQAELRMVSSVTLNQTRKLLRLAKEEMARTELCKKLQQADNEVMEAYRRIAAVRLKKRSPTKKERDMTLKALKEREAILRQLESNR